MEDEPRAPKACGFFVFKKPHLVRVCGFFILIQTKSSEEKEEKNGKNRR
jgi:hypothetical protein